MQASSGLPFLADFFGLFSESMKKMKSESLTDVCEISNVRQRHIEIWWSLEMEVYCFRGCTGPRSQSVDETRSKWNSLQTLIPFSMNIHFQLIYSQTLRALAKRLI